MVQIIHQPHDKLFKQSMRQLTVAREFFKTYLPVEIAQVANFDTLELGQDSFIDDACKSHEADIVYSVQLDNCAGYFYLLCEHQSEVDSWMAFRLLTYIVLLMQEHRKKYPQSSLPIVYPMVIYTGKAPWSASREFFPLFGEQEDLAKQVFLGPYQLVEIHQMSDDDLRKQHWSGLVQFALKYRQVRDVEQFLEKLLRWLNELSKEDVRAI